MVVTNSYFTPQAESLAKANQVELWNRDTLVSRLLDKQERTTDVSAAAALGTPKQQSATESPSPALTAPICATCGKLVSARVHEYCLSHDDIFNGLTYCYEHQQAIRTTIRLNEKQRELSAKM
jgi:restriction system protein